MYLNLLWVAVIGGVIVIAQLVAKRYDAVSEERGLLKPSGTSYERMFKRASRLITIHDALLIFVVLFYVAYFIAMLDMSPDNQKLACLGVILLLTVILWNPQAWLFGASPVERSFRNITAVVSVLWAVLGSLHTFDVIDVIALNELFS